MTHAVRAGRSDVAGSEMSEIRPTGLGLIGILTVLLGAWGALVPFIGPLFGYRSHGQGSWHWSELHGLLYVAPGAVAVLFGLVILGRARAVTRAATGFAGLVVAACGAWFVVGPSLWPTFGTGAVFTPGSTSFDTFVKEVGYNLGVGVLLAVFGGMAMKASTRDKLAVRRSDREVRRDSHAIPAPEEDGRDDPADRHEPIGDPSRPAAGEPAVVGERDSRIESRSGDAGYDQTIS